MVKIPWFCYDGTSGESWTNQRMLTKGVLFHFYLAFMTIYMVWMIKVKTHSCVEQLFVSDLVVCEASPGDPQTNSIWYNLLFHTLMWFSYQFNIYDQWLTYGTWTSCRLCDCVRATAEPSVTCTLSHTGYIEMASPVIHVQKAGHDGHR